MQRDMRTSKLDARTRLSIEMALTGPQGNHALMARQNAEAMRLGMCGAEIDTARGGGSFDLRITRALELALAIRRGGDGAARSRAIMAGMDEAACRDIERIAQEHAIGLEEGSDG